MRHHAKAGTGPLAGILPPRTLHVTLMTDLNICKTSSHPPSHPPNVDRPAVFDAFRAALCGVLAPNCCPFPQFTSNPARYLNQKCSLTLSRVESTKQPKAKTVDESPFATQLTSVLTLEKKGFNFSIGRSDSSQITEWQLESVLKLTSRPEKIDVDFRSLLRRCPILPFPRRSSEPSKCHLSSGAARMVIGRRDRPRYRKPLPTAASGSARHVILERPDCES
jgi:hypothetical protein